MTVGKLSMKKFCSTHAFVSLWNFVSPPHCVPLLTPIMHLSVHVHPTTPCCHALHRPVLPTTIFVDAHAGVRNLVIPHFILPTCHQHPPRVLLVTFQPPQPHRRTRCKVNLRTS
ncbi:hypothetical protein BDN72DRAFT_293997 [Pluteus cervinus]|uniref:Uncharacterized protein n=1 Tax=Pluteus cervinus TaxID=181527 RepID=A0ACD3B400_9AGAR|nr:hypothetical protein BDN72DRAFT_293997 [Pluteus cervinus]